MTSLTPTVFALPSTYLNLLRYNPQKALRALIKTSDGDLRRAITYLQSASRLHSATNPPTPLTAISVQEIGGVVPDGVMTELAKALGVETVGEDVEMGEASNGRSRSAFETVQNAVEKVVREGYSATQVLTQVSGAFVA